MNNVVLLILFLSTYFITIASLEQYTYYMQLTKEQICFQDRLYDPEVIFTVSVI
jgi:hypothetical protein